MKIAVFSTNTSTDYSGGRYLSLIIALSLGYCGHDVVYITNNTPVFYNDFKKYHEFIKLCITNDFNNNLPNGQFDVVILTPQLNGLDFYLKVRLFSLLNSSKLILINFESGNWFNLFAKRSLKLWKQWEKCCQDGCLILSSAKESDKYAKLFYTHYPKKTFFDVWSPSINSHTALKTSHIKRLKERILILVRVSDKHKGANDIKALFSSNLANMTFVFLIGTSTMTYDFKNELIRLASSFNIVLKFKYKLSDYEKFIEYRKASVLVFPSYFEGYGYPPIEALYCDTPCIAYDLPVLKEVTYNSNNMIFVAIGDKYALNKAVSEFFKNKAIVNNRDYKLKDAVNFELNASNLNKVVLSYFQLPNVRNSSFNMMILKFKLLQIHINNYIQQLINRFIIPLPLIVKRYWSIREIQKLSSINIDQNKTKKIIIYGAGTIAQAIIPKIKLSIICIVDNDSSKKNQYFENYAIEFPEILNYSSFDYILVTPKFCEKDIIDSLHSKFGISINKFLVL